jgi:hypothetical protein
MKILKYVHSENYGGGVHFKHVWKSKSTNRYHEDSYRELVAWCHTNWDDYPDAFNDWNYHLMVEVNHIYDDRKSSWFTYEAGPCLYLGTNDDAWAVVFKIAWASLID